MYECGEQPRRRGYREPQEIFLIDLRASLGECAWACSLHVEPRQPQGAADEEHEGEEPAELVELAAVGKRRAVAPRVDEHGRRDAEGEHVRYRVELDADLRRRLRETRDPSVERVEQDRPADGARG